MLPTRYDTGKIIFDALGRIKHLENITGLGNNSNNVVMDNVAIKTGLIVPFINQYDTLLANVTGEIGGAKLSSLIFGHDKQTTVIDAGSGIAQLGTVQDIARISDPTFNSVRLSGVTEIVPDINYQPTDFTFEQRNNFTDGSTICINRFDNSVEGPIISLKKSRNTLTSPSDVIYGDSLGTIYFSGHDGDSWRTPAMISGRATINGSSMVFQTTKNGTIEMWDSLVINEKGDIKIFSTNDSTNLNSGACIISGGVNIDGNLNISENLTLKGNYNTANLDLGGTYDSTSSSSGSLTVVGGAGIEGSLHVGGKSRLLCTFESTSVSSGALRVSGGVGIAGNLYVGESLHVPLDFVRTSPYNLSGTVSSTSQSTGTLTVAGGVGIRKNIFVGGNIQLGNTDVFEYTINNTADSTSISTGSITTVGGCGIAKSLCIGGDITLGINCTDWKNTRVSFPLGGIGRSYVYPRSSSITMAFNGYYDGNGLFVGTDSQFVPSEISCGDGIISISGNRSENSISIDKTGKLKLYNVNDKNIYSILETNNLGEMVIASSNKEISIGGTNLGHRLRFPADIGTFSYITGSMDVSGFEMAYNGYYDATWHSQNIFHKTSSLIENSDGITMRVSRVNGSLPLPVMSVGNDTALTLYDQSGVKKVVLTTNSNGSLSISHTGYDPINRQINIGDVSDFMRIKFPSGYVYSEGDYLSTTFNGYWDGSNWTGIRDMSKNPSSINIKNGEMDFCVATGSGMRPRKTMDVIWNGECHLYYQNANRTDDTKYTTFSTDSTGNMSIQSTGNNIIFDARDKVTLMNASNYSLNTQGGAWIGGNLYVNNILAVNGTMGRNINLPVQNGDMCVNNNMALWDNTSHPTNSYISINTYDTGIGGKGLLINGGGWSGYECDILPPVNVGGIVGTNHSLIQKYDGATYATYTSSSDGSLGVSSTGVSVALQSNVSIQYTGYNAMNVSGGTHISGQLFTGSYSGEIDSVATTTSVNLRNITFWCPTQSSYKNISMSLRDLQIYGQHDGRSIVINDSVYVNGPLTTAGHFGEFPNIGTWLIIVAGGQESTGIIPCTLSVEGPFGKSTEIIIDSVGNIKSHDDNFNVQSCQLVVCNRYASTSLLGNNSSSTGSTIVTASGYASQRFTMVSSPSSASYITEIAVWIYQNIGSDFYVKIIVYQGDGIAGIIKSATTVLCPKSSAPVRVVALLPGSIQLIGGETYTIALSTSSGKLFYVGSTYSPLETSFKVNGITQANRLMSFAVYYSNTWNNYMILAKANTYGQTYKIKVGDKRINCIAQDTQTSILYTGAVYDTFNPPINGRQRIYSENIIIEATTISTSQSTGSICVTGGVGIKNNISVGGLCKIYNSTLSTSTSTGSVIINGGLGCAGQIYCNGLKSYGVMQVNGNVQLSENFTEYGRVRYSSSDGLVFNSVSSGKVNSDSLNRLRIQNTTDTTSVSTGSILISGGVGVAKKYNSGFGNNAGSINSTSISTGTLMVRGGMGIAKNLFVGNGFDININGNSVNGMLNYSKSSNIIKDGLFDFDIVSPTELSAYSWHSCAYSPQLGLYIMTTWIGGYIARSINGTTWVSTNMSAIFNYVIWVPELFMFVAIGPDSIKTIITSPDGINWTIRRAASNEGWRGICWSRKRSRLVCVGQTGPNRCITSSDGINWTVSNIRTDMEWWGVCYSEKLDLFVSVSATFGYIARSNDGVTWQYTDVRTLGGPTYLNNDFTSCWIEWSPELGMFVTAINTTNNGSGDKGTLYSYDGILWKYIKNNTFPRAYTWRSMLWIADYHIFISAGYYASGGGNFNGFIYSYDGLNWTYFSTPNETTKTSVACHYSKMLRQIIVTQRNGILIINPTPEKFIVPNTQNSSSPSSGGLVSFGGCGITENLNVGGYINVRQTTASISYSTGSLIINGGMGIGGAMNIGTTLRSAGSITCGTLTLNGNNVTYGTNNKTGDWTGPVTITNQTVICEKFGNTIRLTCGFIESIAVTPNSIFSFSVPLDLGYYNASSHTNIITYIKNGGVYTYGTLNITNGGYLNIWAGQTATSYFSLGSCGFQINCTLMI